MLLKELRDYLKEQKVVSLQDAAVHFSMQESALLGLLKIFEKKGEIRQINLESFSCSGECGKNCTHCDQKIFEWIGV